MPVPGVRPQRCSGTGRGAGRVTGVYSFPVELAAKIAVRTVARFLQENPDSFDLVEWVLFDTQTESVYEAEVMLYYNIRI